MWCILKANFSVICLKHPPRRGLAGHIDSLVDQLTTASSSSCRRLCHRCTRWVAFPAAVLSGNISASDILNFYCPFVRNYVLENYNFVFWVSQQKSVKMQSLTNVAEAAEEKFGFFPTRRTLLFWTWLLVAKICPQRKQFCRRIILLICPNFSQTDFWRKRPLKLAYSKALVDQESRASTIYMMFEKYFNYNHNSGFKIFGQYFSQVLKVPPKQLSYFFSHMISYDSIEHTENVLKF